MVQNEKTRGLLHQAAGKLRQCLNFGLLLQNHNQRIRTAGGTADDGMRVTAGDTDHAELHG